MVCQSQDIKAKSRKKRDSNKNIWRILTKDLIHEQGNNICFWDERLGIYIHKKQCFMAF